MASIVTIGETPGVNGTYVYACVFYLDNGTPRMLYSKKRDTTRWLDWRETSGDYGNPDPRVNPIAHPLFKDAFLKYTGKNFKEGLRIPFPVGFKIKNDPNGNILPGGKFDPKDKMIEAAAIREFLEETGYNLTGQKILEVKKFWYDQGKKIFLSEDKVKPYSFAVVYFQLDKDQFYKIYTATNATITAQQKNDFDYGKVPGKTIDDELASMLVSTADDGKDLAGLFAGDWYKEIAKKIPAASGK
jgi:ADP-ribose pyrophosphatase YjhB (NUDIX family)